MAKMQPSGPDQGHEPGHTKQWPEADQLHVLLEKYNDIDHGVGDQEEHGDQRRDRIEVAQHQRP